MGFKFWKWEVCANCIKVLCDRTRYFLSYFRLRRLRRKLRELSSDSYPTAGYGGAKFEYETKEQEWQTLVYWVLELKHTKEPQFEWVPWAVLKFGEFRDHLPLVEKMSNRVPGVEDARVRRITRQEANRLIESGISVWRRDT